MTVTFDTNRGLIVDTRNGKDKEGEMLNLPSHHFSKTLRGLLENHFRRMKEITSFKFPKIKLSEAYHMDNLVQALLSSRDYNKLPPIESDEKFEITIIPEFKKFSAEPTYFPKELGYHAPYISEKDFIERSEKLIKNLTRNPFMDWGEKDWVVASKYVEYRKITYNCKCYIDAGNLEVLTGIHQDYETFRANYKPIEEFLNTHGFLPSSLVEPEMEGGCHMNFDLGEVVQLGEHFTSKFLYNYQRLMCDHPSAIWIFLPPNDNRSSQIPFYEDLNQYNKGDFFTIRNKEGHSVNNWKDLSYLEMRHFGMPATETEFRIHYDFCRAILSYVFKVTASNAIISKPSKNFKEYTKERAINELERLCNLIHFNPMLIIDTGKIWRIEKRIEYGPDYLV